MKIRRINEYTKSDLEPIKSFTLKDNLDDRIWNNFELNEKLRIKLLEIGKDFFDTVGIDTNIVDIVLVGSLCNYNWSEKYSDYDLHVIIDFSVIKTDDEILKNLCQYAKTIWNEQHDIKFFGYEVEICLQNIDDLNEAISTGKMGGVYSLLRDKWIKKPEKKIFEIDKSLILEKSKTVMNCVDKIISSNRMDEKTQERINKIWDKIKNFRKSGLNTEGGELSVGNLVFKFLRRNGYIEKVLKLKRSIYDNLKNNIQEND